MNASNTEPAGLYVHIPFCKQKCPYCDFYSITDLARVPSFLNALAKEMERVEWDLPVFDTFYLGGGTPSVLSAGEIEHVIETGFRQFTFLPDVEITVEVNPGTIDAEKLESYRRIGINRLNIGIQSFQNANLAFLGRIHSVAESRQIIDWSRRAGFANLGLDLIYGLPGQSGDNWQKDLQQAVEFMPEHLSCYMLTCDSGSPMSQDVKAGRTVMPSDGLSWDLFDITLDFLDSKGYVQYEISNFARSSDRFNTLPTSRHNQKYWSFAPYIGLGPSAHSFFEPNRRWNHRDLPAYLSDLEAGKLPVTGEETLTRGQLMIEAIYLGLRTIKGIDLAAFQHHFDLNFTQVCAQTIAALKVEDMITLTDSHCRLTRSGLVLADSIASRFIFQEESR